MQANQIKLSCNNCGHSGVCRILPNVDSLIASLFPKESKRDPCCAPEDFANICNCYISKSLIGQAEQLEHEAKQELATEIATQ